MPKTYSLLRIAKERGNHIRGVPLAYIANAKFVYRAVDAETDSLKLIDPIEIPIILRNIPP